jgi:hypothetical protein
LTSASALAFTLAAAIAFFVASAVAFAAALTRAFVSALALFSASLFALASALAPFLPIQEGSKGQCFFPHNLQVGVNLSLELLLELEVDSTVSVDAFVTGGSNFIGNFAIYRVELFYLRTTFNFFL